MSGAGPATGSLPVAPRAINSFRLTPEQYAISIRPTLEEFAVEKIIQGGHIQEAKARLEEDLFKYGKDRAFLFATPLMDLDFAERYYVDAYKVAAAAMPSGGGDDALMFRASLAAASLGEVYDGQRDFVFAYLKRFGGTEFPASLPDDSSPGTVAMLSAMAIAGGFIMSSHNAEAVPFLEIAHEHSPNNPFISQALAVGYVAQGFKYSKALELLRQALPLATKSPNLRPALQGEIGFYEDCLRRVGD